MTSSFSIFNKLILTALILLSTLSVSAQITWQELPAHNLEDIEILHADEDRILGMLNYPPKLLISEDLGTTWTIVTEGFPSENDTPLVDLEADGNYLILFEFSIYRLNPANSEFTQLATLPDNNKIWNQIKVLPNGNFIARERKAMRLYDKAGSLIKEELYPSIIKWLLIGEADEHYYFVSPSNRDGYTVKMNSNLDVLEENTGNEIGIHNHFSFVGGRLYSEYAYSDDGITWVDYQNGLRGIITHFDGGKIHMISGCGSGSDAECTMVYISEDGGETFQPIGNIDLGIVLPNVGAADVRNTTIMGSVALGSDGIILFHEKVNWYSENGLDNWIPIGKSVGNPFALKLEAASTDNVLLGESFRFGSYSVDGGINWTNLENTTQCAEAFEIQSLPEGSLFDSNGCFSNDGGESWNSQLFSGWYFFVKNEVVYYYNSDELLVSSDFGTTWQSRPIIDSDVFIEAEVFDVSSNGFVYINNFWPIEGLNKYTTEGGLVSELDFGDEQLASLKTSYVGPEVYVLTRDNSGLDKLTLHVSLDDAQSFTEKNLPTSVNYRFSKLYTDHLGNLFLYTNKEIWISNDNADTWENISPQFPELLTINDIDVSWDNYLFAATTGTAILRSSEPLAESGDLNVIVYEDTNGDCSYDSSEPKLNNINVVVNGRKSRTDINGELKYLLTIGEYMVSAEFRTDLYTSCNNDHSAKIEKGGDHVTVFIPLTKIEECADVGLTATIPFLRRCFDNSYYLEVYNEGTATATNTQITLELDSLFEFQNCSYPLLSENGNTYTFEIGDVQARQTSKGTLDFELSCDAELGQAHYLSGSISHDNLCTTLEQSKETFECRENIGSYDPNDKSIYVDGIADSELIGENSEIEYLIRFQNTGTDTAFTVRLEDTLTEDFDPSTFVAVAASHDYTWEQNAENLIVTFEDIKLVDSTRNEPDSHGFFRFSVKLKDERPEPSAVITNTAEIFFDFNDPIITNTVRTNYLCVDSDTIISATTCEGSPFTWTATGQSYFATGTYTTVKQSEFGCDSTIILDLSVLPLSHPDCQPSSVAETELKQIEIYPNPTNDFATISSRSGGLESCSVLDLQGAVVLKQSLVKSNSLDLSSLDDGVYLVDVQLLSGEHYRQRVVVVK